MYKKTNSGNILSHLISSPCQDDPQAMLEFALCLRREKDPGAVEWLRATGRKGHPLACMCLESEVMRYDMEYMSGI